MCALLYDSSMRHNCYDVSSLDSRQPVSDDDACSPFSRFIQSSLDCLQENKAMLGFHSYKFHRCIINVYVFIVKHIL